ncbi:MAG: hypothetical protein A2Z15_05070 [Chloroflexi bacterium RBG_16_50_11]|nr:MAG: hypothetical protein A2Z15_05070 [Chloroflexi bacterium RBG_16_50_11]
MPKRNAAVLEVLNKAFDESEGKTVDLVIDHGDLKGISLKMLEWWYVHPHDTVIYNMWHPRDHFSFEWVIPPGENKKIRYMLHATEAVGEFPASVLCIRGEDPEKSPVTPTLKCFDWSSVLGKDDKPIALIFHEHEATPGGVKMRSVFRFPSKTPNKFINAMRKHSEAEMVNLQKILPSLYEQYAK